MLTFEHWGNFDDFHLLDMLAPRCNFNNLHFELKIYQKVPDIEEKNSLSAPSPIAGSAEILYDFAPRRG